ncbi:hypothetical protein AB0P12_27785 [Streptomyces subrutilus]|uniref:hypothetical protein n=1 Tax=Streptomyces subrutilus TaxID=36818 RepID=UPI00342B7E0E
MHVYDCPGTLPGGRGCELCEGWEGRRFEDIRAELAGASAVVPGPRQAASAPGPPRAPGHDDHCERFTYEGGICTCHYTDDYDREPANMIDLEDGISAGW